MNRRKNTGKNQAATGMIHLPFANNIRTAPMASHRKGSLTRFIASIFKMNNDQSYYPVRAILFTFGKKREPV